MKIGTSIKKQAIQIAKQTAEEILKEPKRMLETAGAQTGIVPSKSPEQQQASQNLQDARGEDEAFARKRIGEIEGELAQIRREKEQEEEQRQALEVQEKEIQEQEKVKKPFFSIPGKKRQQGAIPQRVKKHSGTSEIRLQE
ncbi:hypothetical protein KKF11_00365 [Patescibacteria group bacterium]|nr:hypothetical protein [Patescibacteria group bacterium]